MAYRAAKAAMALACLSTATGVSATKYTYVVSGTVDAENSYDDEGLFGSLTNARFTATYVLDDALPTASYSYGPDVSRADGGGLFLAGTTPPVTATLTIGTRSASVFQGNSRVDPVIDPITGDPNGPTSIEQDQGSVYKDAAARQLQLGANYTSSASCCGVVTFESSSRANGLFFDLRSAGFTDPDFRQTGSFALVSSSGYFYDNMSYITRQFSSFNFTDIQLLADRLTVSSDAPEPASWALMVTGFGLAGMGLRLRRRSVAHAL